MKERFKIKKIKFIWLGEEKQTFYLVCTEVDGVFSVLLG